MHTDLWFDGVGDGGRRVRLGMDVPAPISDCEGERIVDTVLSRRSQLSKSISSMSDDRLVSPLGCMYPPNMLEPGLMGAKCLLFPKDSWFCQLHETSIPRSSSSLYRGGGSGGGGSSIRVPGMAMGSLECEESVEFKELPREVIGRLSGPRPRVGMRMAEEGGR